ncbi:chromo domain-containing protein [Apiospora kogelbergensis]|uniref:Chromo domain-containing protein n=1 Tax=Apiospora kogelbergensis TaxID=1337665 RepID=A0AAW0QW46_9PEZI
MALSPRNGLTSRPRTKPGLAKIEIPLSSKPRSYRRGDGPPMAPLSLALKNDSTTFIADKFVRSLDHHPAKLQMHYLVRWTDLPAAALAVPATEILDYVSSRVLEDYEYQLSLEDDQLAEEELEKSRRDQEHARAKPAVPQKPAKPQTKPVGLTKKRGRPRRTNFQPSPSLLSHGPADPAQVPPPPLATTPRKGDKPSLSTPQKTFAPGVYADDLAEDFTSGVDNEDEEEGDLDDALTQQLSRNNEYNPSADGTPAPSTGFTPAGRAVGLWDAQKRPRSPETESTMTPASVTNRKKRRKLSKPEPHSEPTWEVKRLEGHMIQEMDGQHVRFFKVRWEGDWPPGENPSWEPQENLPHALVKKYLRKKAKEGGAEMDLISPLPIPPRPPRKYSSVAEAFEGEIEEAQQHVAAGAVESDHEDERLLVEEDDLGF